MVTALGTNGANGRAFSRATLVNSNPHRVGDRQAHGGQHGRRFFLDGPVNAGLDEFICRHV